MKVRKRQPREDECAESATSGPAQQPSIAPHPDLELLVTRGDTLSGMAGELTGDWQEWPLLHELNVQKVPDPDVLDPGDVLDLPERWRPTDAPPKRRLRRRALRRGMQGGDVRTLQTILRHRGEDVAVDGSYDEEVAEAVVAVQQETELAPDGSVGTNTAEALDSGRSTGTGTWVVEEGDSLGSIAERFTGDWARYAELWVANQDKVPDPDVVSVGVELTLPNGWANEQAPTQAAPPTQGAQDGEEEGLLAVERGQLTFDAEGQEGGAYHSRVAHWPGGNSGVTIGRGYDMGHRSWSEVYETLKGAGVPDRDAMELADGAGLRGTEARDFLKNHDDLPEISQAAQKALFDETYAWYVADVTRISESASVVSAYGEVDFATLDPKLLDLVVDLRYRGDYTRVTRQLVQPLMVANDVEGMARLMANQGHWLGVPEDRFQRRKKWMEEALLHGSPAQPAPEGAEGVKKPQVDIGDADPKGVLSDAWLNPQVKAMAARTLEAMQKEGLDPYIFEGYRSFARQDELYAKGNVTRVRGGGSWHNYGLAVDIVFWNGSHNGPSWGESHSWDAVGRYGKQAGFTEWGGDWGWDRPHLEFHPGFDGSAYDLAPLHHADGLAAVWKHLGVVGDLDDVELVVSDRYGWAAVEGGSLALKKGSRGEAVRELQEKLSDAGHITDVDGVFGRDTERVVRAFQESEGLSVDGVVGRDTARALNEADAS